MKRREPAQTVSRALLWLAALLACVAGACAALGAGHVTVIALLVSAIALVILDEVTMPMEDRENSLP